MHLAWLRGRDGVTHTAVTAAVALMASSSSLRCNAAMQMNNYRHSRHAASALTAGQVVDGGRCHAGGAVVSVGR